MPCSSGTLPNLVLPNKTRKRFTPPPARCCGAIIASAHVVADRFRRGCWKGKFGSKFLLHLPATTRAESFESTRSVERGLRFSQKIADRSQQTGALSRRTKDETFNQTGQHSLALVLILRYWLTSSKTGSDWSMAAVSSSKDWCKTKEMNRTKVSGRFFF